MRDNRQITNDLTEMAFLCKIMPAGLDIVNVGDYFLGWPDIHVCGEWPEEWKAETERTYHNEECDRLQIKKYDTTIWMLVWKGTCDPWEREKKGVELYDDI